MWENITWLMTAHWSRLTLPEFQHPLLHISVFFLWIQPTLIRNITDCCNIISLPVKTPLFSVFMMCSSMWLKHSVLGHPIDLFNTKLNLMPYFGIHVIFILHCHYCMLYSFYTAIIDSSNCTTKFWIITSLKILLQILTNYPHEAESFLN